MTPELVVDAHNALGENPLWDDRRQLLFWCDIFAGEIFSYSPLPGEHRKVFSGAECGAFALQNDGDLLLLYVGEMARLNPDVGLLGPMHGGLSGDTGRFNDCIADRAGRIFTGSTDFGASQLRGGMHRIETDGSATELWRGTNCANGWGFSPDGNHLYFADTTAAQIRRFPYDAASGNLGVAEVWLETPGDMPDGFTVDRAGNLWVAFWNRACIRRYSPDAVLQEEVSLPSKFATSCAFGGPDLADLYITTAGGDVSPDDHSGGLFRIRPTVPGLVKWRSRIEL